MAKNQPEPTSSQQSSAANPVPLTPEHGEPALNLPAAVLWDMDGTLIDTEPYWLQAEISLAQEYGVSWTKADGMALIGGSLEYTGEYLHQRGIPLEPQQVTDRLVTAVRDKVRSEGVPWQPGALQLLQQLHAAGVPQGLVTMSYRVLTQAIREQEPELFQVIICGDEVAVGKPDPHPYLLAAQRLNVPITQCVAVEDSLPGVSSAYASGATAIGIQLNVPLPARPGLNRVNSIQELSLPVLAQVHSGTILDTVCD